MTIRSATIERLTKETEIHLSVVLGGPPQAEISTGIGFLDHMISSLAFHSGMNLTLRCDGDLKIDDHHTAEDCALALGGAIDTALGARQGIVRFGWAYAPLDEALVRAVVDLSGRPSPHIDLGLKRERIGTLATENLEHFLASLAISMRASVHVDVLKGSNDHHRAEAAFKALALALKTAISRSGEQSIPSIKGVL